MFVFTMCADHSKASKVSSMNYPQQMLMEMLIAHVRDQSDFRTSGWFGRSGFLGITKWPGVTCDRAKNVLRIEWSHKNIGGHLKLAHLPSTLEVLRAIHCAFIGTLDLGNLHSVQELSVPHNSFTGEICLIDLPQSLRTLNVQGNMLSGSLDFTQLPPRLRVLSFSNNKFSGSVNITKLPQELEGLHMAHNDLFGTLSFEHVPDTLRIFDAQFNHFEGTVFMPYISPLMQKCMLGSNNFASEAVLGDLPEELYMVDLKNSGVTLVNDVYGVEITDPRLIFEKRATAPEAFDGR